MELQTPEEMLAFGDHLNEVREVLAAAGMVLAAHVGCVKEHVGLAEATEVARFLGTQLGPMLRVLDTQLADIVGKLDQAEPEVHALEEMFNLEPKSRPGANGYL